MLAPIGGLTTAWTGSISPRTVCAISFAHLEPAGAAVHVRVGPPQQRDVGGVDLGRRDVAVGVHHVADRDARPDDLADAADELGVGVRVALGDHRAVLGHQHAIERPLGLQPLELRAGDPLERRGRPRPARVGAGEADRDDVHARQRIRVAVAGDVIPVWP